ncbi:spore germination protein [Ectobacillus funiculus]|uniref:spore germination protein n=1 Tax=Ectobacillus funiculus TaxID=137993 RepID=UPI00397E8140
MKFRRPIPLYKEMKYKTLVKKSNRTNQNQHEHERTGTNKDQSQTTPLYTDLKMNINHIKQTLGNSSDIVIRDFQAGENGTIHMAVFYTDGLADKTFIQDFLLKTLMTEIRTANLESNSLNLLHVYDLLKDRSIPVGEIKGISDFDQLFFHGLSGDTIILINGYSKALAVGSRGWAERGVQEPSSESVVRGPRDGFSETLRINTALIRRRIKDPNLWIETKQIGKKTKTDVAIIYLKNVATEKTIEEVRTRLNRINIDAVLESGYIEELIQDKTYSPFPTVYNTERPDTVAAGILEGRIAIMVDSTPFVLLVPALLVHFFQASEDYYQRADIATLVRILRYFAFFIALLTPSAYIALTTFHQEMLPTPLLVSLTAQREGVPFPAVVEAVMMEVIFEILREAGVRMPKAVGSAISIVGALVIGQAAVEAGIVSAAMVIVVSITAISSFVSPAFNMAITIRMLRFVFIFLAAISGLFGIIFGVIMLVQHLSSLRSFGIPYLAPYSPFIFEDQKDAIFRFPHWALFSRPRLINQQDITREDTSPPIPSQQEPTNQ